MANSPPPPMYSLTPIVSHTTSMDLPSVMYNLPVIQGGTQSKEGLQPVRYESSDLPDFERRQEALLDRLHDLQGSVQKLRESIGLGDSLTTNGKLTGSMQPHSCSSFNLVVRASPTHPPLALLCAANQLKSSDANSVTINCHVHSSLGNTAVPKKLASDFTSECDGGGDGLKFRLTIVWKDVVKDPEAVIGLDTLIRGEANILRYMARRLPNEFPYEEDAAYALKIDQALDIVHHGFIWGDDMQGALKFLDGALKNGGGASIICGSDALTIADYLAWSAMVNAGAADTKLASVSKWAKAVLEVAGRTPPRSGNRKNSARTRRKTKSTRGDSDDKVHNSDGNKTGKENKNSKWRGRRKSSSSKSKSKSGSPQP